MKIKCGFCEKKLMFYPEIKHIYTCPKCNILFCGKHLSRELHGCTDDRKIILPKFSKKDLNFRPDGQIHS